MIFFHILLLVIVWVMATPQKGFSVPNSCSSLHEQQADQWGLAECINYIFMEPQDATIWSMSDLRAQQRCSRWKLFSFWKINLLTISRNPLLNHWNRVCRSSFSKKSSRAGYKLTFSLRSLWVTILKILGAKMKRASSINSLILEF